MPNQTLKDQALQNQTATPMQENKPAARDQTEQKKVEDDIRSLFEHKITFNEHLGIRVTLLGRDKVASEFDMRPELVGHYLYGRLHGGVISSALDAVGGLAILWACSERHKHETAKQVMQRFAHLGTVDLRIDYLRPGMGTTFIASAEVMRLGGRIASTRMQLENEHGLLIATGSAAYIVS